MNKSFLSFLMEQPTQTSIQQLDMATARFKYPGGKMNNACAKYKGNEILYNQCMYDQLNKQQEGQK